MPNYLDRFKMASCPLKHDGFFDSKPDQNIPLWSQKWKGNMLQNTRMQNPKSDDNMKDLCVKTQTPRI